MNGNARRLTVPIVYHYVAHYRQPVFAELVKQGADEGIEYVVAADPATNVKSLKVVDAARFSAENGSRWVALRNLWMPKKLLWQRGLISYLWRTRPDAVIFLGDFHFLSTWIACITARVRGTRVLMWTQGVRQRERGMKRALRVGFYSLAHALMVYGFRARTLLQEMGLRGDRIHVIFNSLDYPTQSAVRAELALRPRGEIGAEMLGPGEDPLLVFAGRLERSKELELLLRAVARLKGAGKTVRLVCVGDGPLRSEMKDMAVELGIDRQVVFWGSCYDEAVLARLFHIADLAVSPGPVGLFAIHSLAYGTPILISDAVDKHGPEFEAVVPGRTGAVFKAGSVESLSAVILESLDGLKKPDVSAACVQAVEERYNPLKQAQLINSAVRGVVPCDARSVTR